MKNRKSLLLVIFLSIIFLGQSLAFAKPKVAYIHGSRTSSKETVRKYLKEKFEVDLIDGDGEKLPTISDLSKYDAIMASTNQEWTHSGRKDELGDLLASYVDEGGGLVITTFAWQAPEQNGLQGRLAEGYSPFVKKGDTWYKSFKMGSHEKHPIMDGVHSLSAWNRDAVAAINDAQIIAKWSDGLPLVAVNTKKNVVGISFFPEVVKNKIKGDYAKLFINSLDFVIENKARGLVVALDGMDGWASILPDGETSETYLNKAINDKWRETITKKIGPIVTFTWTRSTADTEETVHQLYEYIKSINAAGGSVIILSHSWGTVLAYIALVKHQDIHVDKLITLGSPLESAYLGVSSVTRWWLAKAGIFSVKKPDNVGIWDNYWTQCDIIAAPIPALPEKDDFINKTLYDDPGACHASYFEDDKKWDKILADVSKPLK